MVNGGLRSAGAYQNVRPTTSEVPKKLAANDSLTTATRCDAGRSTVEDVAAREQRQSERPDKPGTRRTRSLPRSASGSLEGSYPGTASMRNWLTPVPSGMFEWVTA